uniref:Uncharacterized protein n=1 Tax=Ralstonia solanacearum TaxID=305 RepID=A0A0S4WZY2_RALSL|nr:protein of unknown function [Ralstonia solanacearum]
MNTGKTTSRPTDRSTDGRLAQRAQQRLAGQHEHEEAEALAQDRDRQPRRGLDAQLGRHDRAHAQRQQRAQVDIAPAPVVRRAGGQPEAEDGAHRDRQDHAGRGADGRAQRQPGLGQVERDDRGAAHARQRIRQPRQEAGHVAVPLEPRPGDHRIAALHEQLDAEVPEHQRQPEREPPARNPGGDDAAHQRAEPRGQHQLAQPGTVDIAALPVAEIRRQPGEGHGRERGAEGEADRFGHVHAGVAVDVDEDGDDDGAAPDAEHAGEEAGGQAGQKKQEEHGRANGAEIRTAAHRQVARCAATRSRRGSGSSELRGVRCVLARGPEVHGHAGNLGRLGFSLVGVILVEMAAARFFAGRRAQQDEMRRIEDVLCPQRLPVRQDAGMALLQLGHVLQADLEPRVAAHDPGVVPQDGAQVGEEVRVEWRLDPLRQRQAQARCAAGGVRHGLRAGLAHDDAFQQRIAGQPVRAVQAAVGHFADGIQPFDIGAAGHVGADPAARVMRRRRDRHAVLRQVAPMGPGDLDQVREMLFDECRALVRDVEPHMGRAVRLHLRIDRAGHDVARRQFLLARIARHEALVGDVVEQAAFAAHGFGDQADDLALDLEGRGVELHELQILDGRSGTPGHGDGLALARVRVGRVLVQPGQAAGGKHHRRRAEDGDFAVGQAFGDDATDGLPVGDQFHRLVLPDPDDVGQLGHLGLQGPHDAAARHVVDVRDAAFAVSAFAGQVDFTVFAREGHALVDQPAQHIAALAHDLAHGRLIAQAVACEQRIADVLVMVVIGRKHRRNTPLRPIARRFIVFVARDDADFQTRRQMQQQRQGGQAFSNYQYIEFHIADFMFRLTAGHAKSPVLWTGENCSAGRARRCSYG